jgi:hypothetical protein
MKSYLVCGVLCAFGFFAMAMQLGMFRPHSEIEGEEVEEEQPVVEAEEATKKKRLRFPVDLAPAAKAQAVPEAAAWAPSDEPHKMAFFKVSGGLHPWQDNMAGYHPEWAAERVEETELVVVVGGQRKWVVQVYRYPNGAPPVTRYQFELEASLIEAKTGRVLANRQFHNVPRLVRGYNEDWSLTALGKPVTYHTVFRWAQHIARWGPPAVLETAPIINVVGD